MAHELQNMMIALQPQSPSLLGQVLISAVSAIGSAFGARISNSIMGDGGDDSESGPRPTKPPTLQFAPPQRLWGGPVEAGEFYETHGLGKREFFRPHLDGDIVAQASLNNYRVTNNNDNRRQPSRVHHTVEFYDRTPKNVGGYTTRRSTADIRETLLKFILGGR